MGNYWLTKSKFIRGLQCPKALFYDIYHKEYAVISPELQQKFRQGRAFEKTFKDQWTKGIDVSKLLGWRMEDYAPTTQQLLQQNGEITLYEAGFLYNGVLVLIDVLHKDSSGNIDLYEVKNSSQEKQVFHDDIAIQYYATHHSLSNIQHFYLVLHDEQDKFLLHDILPETRERLYEIENQVEELKKVVNNAEPQIKMSEHCHTPYDCPYIKHCSNSQQQLTLSFE